MNTNGNRNCQELAKWIRKGWRRQEADKFRYRYLPVENGKYTLSLYTLGFALLGKVGSLEEGIAQLEEKIHESPDPFGATAEFFSVPKKVVRRIGDLEGPCIGMHPNEIADMLERDDPYFYSAVTLPAARAVAPRAVARKR
jgi:hypothetical protein